MQVRKNKVKSLKCFIWRIIRYDVFYLKNYSLWCVLSGELSVMILSLVMFSSKNLTVSIFSLEISRLINFVFPREHVSFALKTVNIGKWSLMSVWIISDWILFSETLLVKGTLTHIYKTVFREVLFIWSSMQIFSFIGYTLTELFGKPDNWRQIYKQTSSTFYISNDI